MIQTRDIETELYNKFTELGCSASAHSVPATLGAEFPHIHITRTGGTTTDRVIETHYVDFDVYHQNGADAMEAACSICGVIRDLERVFYSSEITTLPYNNPDPRHPSIGRATIKASILARIKEV